jgi:transaldolase
MNPNSLQQVGALGQSIWLDYIRRDLMAGGGLRRLIEEDGLRGMTSNPAIFEKAIAESREYDGEIRALALEKNDAGAIYEALSRRDVQAAADEFRPLYDRTDGRDGYVSLEVNPHLAHDTIGTIGEARRLWGALDRPNVFIKVPATAEGLPAIQELIGEGINVNVTLLFGLSRYRQVAEAYLAGLETRASQGQPLKRVASVASFFVSRIDSLVDPLLEQLAEQGGAAAALAKDVHGQVAVASAKMAYQAYKGLFGGDRFRTLAAAGARVQRLLWASTGTKNSSYSDVKYVEALIGPDTVNTADGGAGAIVAGLPGESGTIGPSMKTTDNTLSAEQWKKLDAYWRAANYLSVGQIYLYDNPLLKKPLALKHIKPRLLGPLGHDAGAELHLRASEPHHQRIRSERHLHHRPRATAGRRLVGERLSGGDLQRGLPPTFRRTRKA